MKARKKPVVIDCFVLGKEYPDWFADKVASNEIITHAPANDGAFDDMRNHIAADIKTLEGIMHANNGDIIIKGVNGEIYPCKPDIFEKTYEIIDQVATH